MIILLHTSKTMRVSSPKGHAPRNPELLGKTKELAAYVQSLSTEQLQKVMHISPALAQKTRETLAAWNSDPGKQSLAIDSFVGDIYSGLRASTLTEADRDYADGHLRILSGLYGIIRPYDGILPYRLEMGYKLPDQPFSNLYDFWGDSIAKCLPEAGPIINLASVEYSRTVTPFVDGDRVVAPKFLTVNPKTGQPEFVVVHAKIARGAFARWLIVHKVNELEKLSGFTDIGYAHDPALSTAKEPAFVCREFAGKGLSMRLQK